MEAIASGQYELNKKRLKLDKVNIYRFFRHLLPIYFWCIPNDRKEIYLSFDDGPIPELTEIILNLLSKKNVKATFFLVGENVLKYPDLYNSILKEGHRVGNHTFNHLKGWKTPKNEYVENVRKASKYINSNLFRPPYGRISNKQGKRLKLDYKIIMWSILTRDYDKKISPEECLSRAKKARSGDIIVFHDHLKAQENMLYALPRFIDFAHEKGFVFKTIPEIEYVPSRMLKMDT